MLVDTVNEALRSVLTIPGVLGTIAVVRDVHRTSREASTLPASLLTSVVRLGTAFLDETDERKTTLVGDKRVALRRIDDCVACVIAEASVPENDLQRKLSAIAIRTLSHLSQEPPSPVIPKLREIYLAVAGPLSGLVFDRAVEQLKIARRARTPDALKELMVSLAGPVSPPYVKTELLAKANALIDAETANGHHQGGGSMPPSGLPSAPRIPAMPSSAPPRADGRRVRLSALVHVVHAARDVLGAGSDATVISAVSELEHGEAAGMSPERLVSVIAAGLEEPTRSKFTLEARARLTR